MVWGADLGWFPVNRKAHIGSKDLLMPEKTHGCSLRLRCQSGCLLELLGRPISQRGMQPYAIVVALDEICDVLPQVIQIAILTGIDLLSLERFQEALATSVVVGIGGPTHARNHAVPAQDADVDVRSVLHPAIRMMH